MTMLDVYLARMIYDEKVRKAEAAWRMRQLPRQTVRRISPLRIFLGNLLIGSGSRLKGTGHATLVGT